MTDTTPTPTPRETLADRIEALNAKATPEAWHVRHDDEVWTEGGFIVLTCHAPSDVGVAHPDASFVAGLVNAYRSGDLAIRTSAAPTDAVTDAEVEAAHSAYKEHWIGWVLERGGRREEADAFFAEQVSRPWMGALRAALEAARNAVQPSPALERVRHVKSGSEYEVLGEAEAQVTNGGRMNPHLLMLREGDNLTIYRDPTSGKLWCRAPGEFRDGRFETIHPPRNEATTPPNGVTSDPSLPRSTQAAAPPADDVGALPRVLEGSMTLSGEHALTVAWPDGSETVEIVSDHMEAWFSARLTAAPPPSSTLTEETITDIVSNREGNTGEAARDVVALHEAVALIGDLSREKAIAEAALAEAKERIARLEAPKPEPMFPIMRGPAVPWFLIAPYEAQARANHYQSLKRLAERGGLNISEAMAVMSGVAYEKRPIAKPTVEDWLDFIADRKARAEARAALLSPEPAR